MDDDELWSGDFFLVCFSSSCLHQQLGDPGGDAEAEEYPNARLTHHDGICFSCTYLECHLVIAHNIACTRIPKTNMPSSVITVISSHFHRVSFLTQQCRWVRVRDN